MKRPEERGPVGAWAYRTRQEADLTVEQVVERLAVHGYAVKASTLRGIEGGSKKPGARLLRLIAEVYGSEPPGGAHGAPHATLIGATNETVAELPGRESTRLNS